MSDNYISELMQPPHYIHPSANVEESANQMSSLDADALLIKQEEEYIGIFTKTDLIKLLKKNMNPFEVIVSNIMSKPILSLDAKTASNEARKKMQKKNILHYAVTQNKKNCRSHFFQRSRLMSATHELPTHQHYQPKN